MHNEMKDQYHSVAGFYEYKARKHKIQARYWRDLARHARHLAWLAPKHNPTNDAITQARWFKAGMATLYGRMTDAQ